MTRFVSAFLIMAGLFGSCQDTPPSAIPSTAPSTVPSAAVGPPGPRSACPVTIPTQAPHRLVPAGLLFGESSAHGNDQLWVGGLGDGGVIRADPSMLTRDGYIGWKFGWYRIARGFLEISARRLDGGAPPTRTHVPEGYGNGGFQSSGVDFSTQGCWELIGSLTDGEAVTGRLTFVTYVLVSRP